MKTRLVDHAIDVVFVILLVTLVTFLSQSQKQISAGNGRGWDGVSYAHMSESFLQKLPIINSIGQPYAYRLGEPWLVAMLFPQDIDRGFFLLNQAFSILSLLMFLMWAKFFIKKRVVLYLALTVLATHWEFSLRYSHFYPVYIDPSFGFFSLLALVLAERIKKHQNHLDILLFCVLSFVGAFFREAFLIVCFALPFCINPIKPGDYIFNDAKRLLKSYLLWLPFIISLITFVSIKATVGRMDGYTFTEVASRYLYNKPFGALLYAACMSLGVTLAVLFCFRKWSIKWLMENQYVLIVSLGFLMVAYLGGSDSHRFFSWLFPVIVLMCAACIEQNAVKNIFFFAFGAVALAAQALSNRLFFNTPDPASGDASIIFLTPLSELSNGMLLVPEYNSPLQSTMLIQYLCVFVLLYVLADMAGYWQARKGVSDN